MRKPLAKPTDAYHHGNLEHALVEASLQTIREGGIQELTLRNVAAKLGVSRTALYRHFDDKNDLLARMAAEGFRLLHRTLAQAVANSSRERGDTLPVMCVAYVHFATANWSHYEAMFGALAKGRRGDSEVAKEAEAALGVLVDVMRDAQLVGRMSAGDPIERAELIWAFCHGIAMLGSRTHMLRETPSVEELAVVGCSLLEKGMQSS